jgi:hypothetical protein
MASALRIASSRLAGSTTTAQSSSPEISCPAAIGAAGKTKRELDKRTEKQPRPHGVYVAEGEGDKAFWTRIGAAWPHDDGKGFNISLS